MVQDIELVNDVTNAKLPLSTTKTDYYILDSVDWGVIQATHYDYKYIGQYGVTYVGHTVGVRDIEIKGWIIARTEKEMTQRKKALNKFFNPLNLLKLNYSSYVLEFYCQTSIKYGSTESENNEVICHWAIDGVAPDPFFRLRKESYYKAAAVNGMFMFPLVLKDNYRDSLVFGEHKKTTFFNVYNTGHVPTGFKVTFYARGGAVTNPKLIHVRTQEYIKINKELQQGESVIIDTNRGNRSVIGVIENEKSNYFIYKDIGSSWITLQVGKNEMNYSADSGINLLDVTIDFNYRYEEVQECY